MLLVWLTVLIFWNSVLVGPLERRFVVPLVETDINRARFRRAAMVFLGLSLTQMLPLLAWMEGTTFSAVIATCWILSAATQIFVYYSRDRMLLLAGAIPIMVVSLAGPAIAFGLSWEAATISLFLFLALGAGAAFVGRSDRLIASAAAEADARRSAEAASFAKSRFIANMHHELRTPLNAIIGYSEMLRESAAEEGRNADVADLDRVLAAAHLQLMMMGDLLAFSDLQDGRSELKVRSFDASAAARETAEALRAEIEANGNTLVLNVSESLLVRNDDGKFRHCLDHLLSNAAKFTRNGQVRLALRRDRNERGEWLVADVEDTGVGIPKERIAAIFEPFTQADESTTREYEGAGVGLAITSRLARVMGGAATVQSAPGRGSVFTLRIRADLEANVVEPRLEALA
jgi:signal transduction histidine kinase